MPDRAEGGKAATSEATTTPPLPSPGKIFPAALRVTRADRPALYQDFGRADSIFVDFFGIPTATIAGLSRIAAMTGAKVIPAIPTREADNTVSLRFYPAWENFPGADTAADTQRMNDFIEARVREQPAQYFWLHKRFKTRPEGEAGFY